MATSLYLLLAAGISWLFGRLCGYRLCQYLRGQEWLIKIIAGVLAILSCVLSLVFLMTADAASFSMLRVVIALLISIFMVGICLTAASVLDDLRNHHASSRHELSASSKNKTP